MADFLNGVFISEILADNAGGSAVDVDGDGNANKADEFIEFGNVSGAPISLDGYEVWSQKNGQLYAFGPGDVLNDGEAATVVGNYTGTPPAGFYSAGIPENGNFLPDGEGQKYDSIFLVDTATGDYIVLSYGKPPRAPVLPAGFPGTNRIGSGESVNSNAPNGAALARDANGVLIETTPTPNVPNIACFAEDTVILTRHGERPVADLRPGDMIPTYGHGMQRLLGVCSSHISPDTLLRAPSFRPLTVDSELFGAQLGIRLSPAHCMLYTSPYAEALFASAQVLLPARHLQAAGFAHPSIPRNGVTYHHLLFADHTLVMANGMWSETLLNTDGSGTDAHSNMSMWTFDKGITLENVRHRHSVRPVLRRYEALVLLDRLRARKTERQTPSVAAPLEFERVVQLRQG